MRVADGLAVPLDRRPLGPLQFAAAAAGFLYFSIGVALTVVGGHLFDQIEVSQRWASLTRGDAERDGVSPSIPSVGPPS